MNNKLEERKKFIVDVLYFAFVAALIYFSVKYALGWVFPFIIGFLVALLLRPLINLISNKSRIPRPITAVIIALLFYAVAGTLLTLIGVRIFVIIQDGIASLPEIYKNYIEPFINTTLTKIQELTQNLDPTTAQFIQNITDSFAASASTVVSSVSSQVIAALSSVATSLPSFLLAVLLSVISSIFFAVDFSKVTDFIVKSLPEKPRSYVLQLKTLSAEIGLKYLKSYTILMSITFVELAIGLSIFSVPNAIAVAALIALIDMLPLIGTGGILIPWILIELLRGDLTLATQLFILYIIIVIIRNILEPKIVGQQIGIHPLAMLVSIYVGLQIFGFIGVFVLPLILVVTRNLYVSSQTPLKTRRRTEKKPDAPPPAKK